MADKYINPSGLEFFYGKVKEELSSNTIYIDVSPTVSEVQTALSGGATISLGPLKFLYCRNALLSEKSVVIKIIVPNELSAQFCDFLCVPMSMVSGSFVCGSVSLPANLGLGNFIYNVMITINVNDTLSIRLKALDQYTFDISDTEPLEGTPNNVITFVV